ncbi:hypothetical protein GCM10009133_15570 [Cocleimonas flava]|jgi:hypothetical protein|uniref:DUF2970 family protein n=1 Tax=Cocleimonas flava TaxID=634765 RepID=A0A4V6NCC7_9GAMM|nr:MULTISPECIES: DUF2970 domain-containing protein [Cocleimonas]MEB8434235.1 DUF2970 domain-containing protein [Cocleimonas sp. KMM 6892]MEC4717146.1 DUF2970 domain-containing protein [Cocleimonas sp. KMM 6895]MEC4746507.1 DUF2970 domain-containing protein [Cocleimonas sp. KMM 6896]TCJ84485.1 DUF2970 family protein [Cocleimonas flava]
MEFLRAIKSVMSAMIGVQKKKNLEEDFSKTTAMPFIVAGILMTIVFILAVWAVVNLALNA